MTGFDLVDIVSLVGYLTLFGLIGYYGYRRTFDEADFLVANRDIGPVLGAGTLLASQISASTAIGAVGIHYQFGIGFIWIWFGLLAGWIVALVLVAPQLRGFGGMTVPDFVGTRYADDGVGGDYARAISALLIVAVFTVFLTAQYTAGSLIFQHLFDVSENIGLGLTAAIAVAYTAFGGMRASVLTDFFQAVVLIGGLVLAVPVMLSEVGGLTTLVAELREIDPALVGQALPLPRIGGFMAASAIGIAAAPVEISRFYAMRDEETVRSAIRISLVAQMVIALAVATLGVGARVLFPALETPDMAALVLSQQLLGPVAGTVFVLALLSAILSTVDSVMLVASAGIAHDIYAKMIRTDGSEWRILWVNRSAVLVVGLLPVGMAFQRELFGGLITLIALLNLSLQGAMLFVPVVLGLHWRRATTTGGIGGMIGGFATALAWHVATDIVEIVPTALAANIADPVIPGVGMSLVVFVAISLLTGPPSSDSTAPFFSEDDEDPS